MLLGVGSTVVDGILTPDSTLLLPAREVAALLGTDVGTGGWTSLTELRHRWPPITVTWIQRELRVLVDDPLAVLPRTRQLIEQQQRQARGTSSALAVRSGPFGAFTFDQLGHELVEGGYTWRGRVAVMARRSNHRDGLEQGASTWGVSFAPLPAVFLSYLDGNRQPPIVSGRLAVGPMWLSTTWTPTHTHVDGLVRLGSVSLFASSRQAYAITVRGPISAQVGRVGGLTTGRVSFGPVPPSPFIVPQP